MAFIDEKTKADLTPDSVLEPTVVALVEEGGKEAAKKENLEYSELVALIKNKYSRSKEQRRFDEQRWLTAYSNYRGIYGPDVMFTDTEKSRAFIKITKTKVLAAYAQILDIIFAGNRFPVGVEASKVPVGVADAVHFDPKSAEKQMEKMGQAPQPAKRATIAREDIINTVGSLREQLEPVAEQLKEGPGKTPSSLTFEPAKEAARAMDKLMQDQFEEANTSKEVRSTVFDMCGFGTGIFKGPFAVNKEYPRWREDGTYDPIVSTIPDFSHVSIWNAYPDPDARNMKECEHFIERHKMSRTQLRALKRRPHFREESIESAIECGTDYVEEYWESSLNDSEARPEIDRFEVLEYWGIVDKDIAEKSGIKFPKEFKDRDQVQINAWICNDKLLRVVLNPFTPARIPYYAVPYELNPYSFFGVGVAENMEDTQLIMNGSFRQMIDNAVLSSNVMLEIDETNMVDGQDFKIYPGKIFRRQGGQPGQMINSIKVDSRTQDHLMIFDKARQLADEATGMPSYSHGISGVMGVGRTASGMSMLMGAAKENIKSVVRNIDDYLLTPLGKATFAFNMQFNFDKKYIGDVEVVARGTESLMRNEIRSQKLLQFLQITANPMDAPFVKRDYILRELAQSLDLEPEKVVNDPREAAIQAEMIAEMSKAMGVPPMGAQGGNPTGAPSPMDPTGTGGGNIAPGAAPVPGEQGGTHAGGGSMNAAMANGMGQGQPQ